MIGNIEIRLTIKDKDEPVVFTGENLDLKSLDKISGMTINRFKWFFLYRNIKRISSMDDKEKIRNIFQTLKCNLEKGTLKSANLSFEELNTNKKIVDMNLLEDGNLNEVDSVFQLNTMSNGGFIIYSNLFLILTSVFFMTKGMNALEHVNHLFMASSVFMFFLYTSVVPVIAAVNLVRTRNLTGTSYFDGYFVSKYISFPAIFIFSMFNIGFALEFACQHNHVMLPKIYPLDLYSLLYLSLFFVTTYFASKEVLRRFKKYQDMFLI